MALVARVRFGARQSARQPSYDQGGDVTVWVDYRDSITNALTAASGVAFAVSKADGTVLSPAPSVVTEQAGIYKCVFTPDQAGLWAIEASSTTSGATNDRREFLIVSDSAAPAVVGPTAVTSVNGAIGPAAVIDAGDIEVPAAAGATAINIATSLRYGLGVRPGPPSPRA